MNIGPTATAPRPGSSLHGLRQHLQAGWPLALACLIPALVFVLQRDVSLNLEDEGFLWYGVQRVVAGEVPVRDFQSYDIGRYYWHAAWMWLTGSTGIMPLRAGSAALAALTVGLVVVLLRRARQHTAPLQAFSMALAVFCFSLWMVPYFKVADSFAALLLLAGLTKLLASPSPRGFFAYGVCLGVAGVIGINHGLYGVLALALALAWLLATGQSVLSMRLLGALVAGVGAGYAPMLVFMLAVPGFAHAFIDSIRILSEIGTTNLHIPMPSPWAVWHSDDARLTERVHESLMGAGLWAGLAFLGLCAWTMLRHGRLGARRLNPVFVAAVLTTLPYAHYFWSRANFMHFAVSVLPLLVAAWSLPAGGFVGSRRSRASGAPVGEPVGTPFGAVHGAALLLVTLASGLLAGPNHPLFQLVRPGTPLQTVTVAGETLRVRDHTAEQLQLLQQAAQTHAANGRAVYVVPYWPGAYAVLSRRSPTWENYKIFPSTLARQQRELERLIAADIGVALVLLHAADKRADLGFEQTQPEIARHLRRCMRSIESDEAARLDVLVFVSRNRPCDTP